MSMVAFIYHDPQRQKILRERKGGRLSNDEPVFLSETGDALTTDSITRIAGKIFADALVEDANIHRLRARYIIEVIETLLDRLSEQGVTVNRSESWENQVLMMAVELMGHSHPLSLRPYLNDILNRRLTAGGKSNHAQPNSASNRLTASETNCQNTSFATISLPRLIA